ncbi:HAD-like domain-containing protein, partial [Jimgerdemannia flammicorona]
MGPITDPIRVVASDLDGTLLGHSEASPRSIAVLHRLQNLGIKIVLASGRPSRAMIPVVEQTGIQGLSLCCNGALVFDAHQRKIIKKYSIPTAVVRAMVAKLRHELEGGVYFGAESGAEFRCEPGYYSKRKQFVDHSYVIQDAMTFANDSDPDATVEKLIVLHPTLPAEELYHILLKILDGDEWRSAVKITWSNVFFVEVSAVGVCKGSSLAALCEAWGVDKKEVIAFGDMPNDVEMITWAGRGVAVKNAHSDVLAVADEVTLSNWDDGVAVVLEDVVRNLEAEATNN